MNRQRDIGLPQTTFGIAGKTSGHYRDGLYHIEVISPQLTVQGPTLVVKSDFGVTG